MKTIALNLLSWGALAYEKRAKLADYICGAVVFLGIVFIGADVAPTVSLVEEIAYKLLALAMVCLASLRFMERGN